MLNLLKKTTPWMVASLFVATTVFGQDRSSQRQSCAPKTCDPKPCTKTCPQPTPPTQLCPPDNCCPAWPAPVLNAAYNYPSHTQTRCPWNMNFDVSLIVWQPSQSNMEIGALNRVLTGVNARVINMDFDWTPGFKIGAGGYFDYDHWDMHFEYTYFHSTQNKTANAGVGQFIIPTVGTPASTLSSYTGAKGNWNLKMDLADLDLGRWYYVGTKLTFRPNVGVRAAWIRQANRTVYTAPTEINTVTGRSSSWGVGLKTGLDTNWMFGYGFRMFGNAEADLLATQYTRLLSKTVRVATPAIDTFRVSQHEVTTVRPHVDLGLGFGWGTYLDCNNWYLDFAVAYDFQVFFDQNMFRNFTDDAMAGKSIMPNGNLYTQGVTVTAKLDF